MNGESAFVPTHSVNINLDEGEGEGVVPAEGGSVQYYSIIENSDLTTSYKDLIKWSVLTLPTGEDYSIHKAKTVQLGAGESREYVRPKLNIPEWFPAGEYSFTWSVADPENEDNIINSDTFTFEKLAE